MGTKKDEEVKTIQLTNVSTGEKVEGERDK